MIVTKMVCKKPETIGSRTASSKIPHPNSFHSIVAQATPFHFKFEFLASLYQAIGYHYYGEVFPKEGHHGFMIIHVFTIFQHHIT